MITSITLQNFRAFQDEVTVRVRPLTVLIGKNSAGKSSFIKFLLMLKQTLESQADSFFITEGRDVQLGTWEHLRHTRTRERSFLDSHFRFSVEIVTQDLPSPDIQEMWKVVSLSRAVSTEGEKMVVHVEFPRQRVPKHNPAVRFLITGDIPYRSEFKSGRHDVIGFLGDKEVFRKSTRNLERSRFLNFSPRTDSVNEAVEAIAAEPFLEPLRHEFVSQRHLSPVREESLPAVQIGSPPPRNVGDRGEYSMPHLARILTDSKETERAEFINKHAAAVGKLDEVSFSRRVAALVTHITARNTDTQAACSLADFGFGVSQCLPIFIQGAMHYPGQLLIVEQPEAQLHPTAQLEMGTFFAELWNVRKVPSVIETHSPNIILRLRTLISKGVLKASDVSLAFFTLGEIPGKRGAAHTAVVVKNIDINPDGSLHPGLPMEFFGADVLEAFEMGSGHKL